MIIDEDVSDFLEHYGVKGQKWGVRNARKGRVKTSKKKKLSPDQKAALQAVALVGGSLAAGILARAGAKKLGLVKPREYGPKIDYDKIGNADFSKIAAGTKYISRNPAMTRKQFWESQGSASVPPAVRRSSTNRTKAMLERELARPRKQTTMTPRQALAREKARRR